MNRKIEQISAIRSAISRYEGSTFTGIDSYAGLMLVDDIMQLIADARREELEAIANYEPVSVNFDYRQYARERVAEFNQETQTNEAE